MCVDLNNGTPSLTAERSSALALDANQRVIDDTYAAFLRCSRGGYVLVRGLCLFNRYPDEEVLVLINVCSDNNLVNGF